MDCGLRLSTTAADTAAYTAGNKPKYNARGKDYQQDNGEEQSESADKDSPDVQKDVFSDARLFLGGFCVSS